MLAKRTPFLPMMLVFLAATAAWADDDSGPVTEINGHAVTSETWDVFTVSYPAGRWDISVEHPDDDHAYYQLTAKSAHKIVLRISLVKGLPSEDPHYENNPNAVNTATLLPVALSLANNDESRIFHSIGTTNLPDFWEPTSRITVLQDGGMAINLEACHDVNLETGRMLIGLVMTESKAGLVNEDPTYPDFVFEAYQIISSIHIRD